MSQENARLYGVDTQLTFSDALSEEPYIEMFESAYGRELRDQLGVYQQKLVAADRNTLQILRGLKFLRTLADIPIDIRFYQLCGEAAESFDRNFNAFLHTGHFDAAYVPDNIVGRSRPQVQGKFARWATATVVDELRGLTPKVDNRTQEVIGLQLRKALTLGARVSEEFEDVAIDRGWLEDLITEVVKPHEPLPVEDLKTFVVNPPRA